MNDRYLLVLKKIVSDKQKIVGIHRSGRDYLDIDEFYFAYKDVIFSVMQRNEPGTWGTYSFYLYPKAQDIDDLINAYDNGDVPEDLVVLHSSDLPTDKQGLLEELYVFVKQSHLGLDDIFDKLLRD